MLSTERFTGKEDYYEKYRPHYPSTIINTLKEKIDFNSNWVVADIGAGTGISTKMFVVNGNTVYAVEPNAAMRSRGEQSNQNNKNFISINGAAEATTLNDKSVDLIIAGQAFHWFNVDATRKEFKRIAKPGAYVMLFWNMREVNTEFEKHYEDLLLEYGTDYKEVGKQNRIQPKQLQHFFAPCSYETVSIPNHQLLDYEHIKGRLLSASYIPKEGEPNHDKLLNKLKMIFDKNSTDNKLDFGYTTEMYLGKVHCN